jgi:peptidoglycan/xylan/chitin deacetylase (PgdA/CDA1 family)
MDSERGAFQNVDVEDLLAGLPQTVLKDAVHLLRRRYPPVTYGVEDAGYLPVFVFHTVTEADLTRKLDYLEANGYRTVSLDEAVAWLAGSGPLPRRAVVLTIDDGRYSTWAVAAPLLERYGMRATAYVVPGYLGEGEPRPTLGELWDRRARRQDVEPPEREDASRFMRWSEVEALQRGGAVSVQSHSMLHRRVFAGPTLTGFMPRRWTAPLFNVPQHPEARRAWTRAAVEEAAGSPLFEYRPLLGLARAWIGGEAYRELCLERVRREGAEAFFARNDWQRILRALRSAADVRHPQWVDLGEEKRWELAESRRVLQDRLPGSAVRHFCYPNSSGRSDTISLARDAGYASSAWGLLDHRFTNRQGAQPHLLSRMKHDFIVTLPGDGRRSLLEVLRTKLSRRLRGNKGY